MTAPTSGGQAWAALAVPLALLCFYQALLGIAGRTLEFEGYYDHLLLVLVVSGWLGWRRWLGLEATSPSLWGWPPLLLGLWLNVAGGVQGLLLPQVFGLWLAALGLVLLHTGWIGVRELRFPLAFMLLALPLPRVWLDSATGDLRRLVSWAAGGVLSLLNIPCAVSGSDLLLSGARVRVDPSCGGLQGAQAFLALGAFVAREATSPARAAVIVLSVVPLAIASNLLRVLCLTWLAVRHPALVGEAWLHAGVGLLIYGGGILLLLALLANLSQGAERAPELPGPHPEVSARGWPRVSPLAVVCLGAGAVLGLALPVARPAGGLRPISPALDAAPWRGEQRQLSPPVEGALYVRYVRACETSFVDLYAIRRMESSKEFHSPSACFPSEGFSPLPMSSPRHPGLPQVARVERYGKEGEEYLVADWTRSDGGLDRPPPQAFDFKLAGLLGWLLPGTEAATTDLRLATPWDDRAMERLGSFCHEALSHIMPPGAR